ncbi:MAG TPA: PASTA domain-containing protein [Spirochaetota bacterium]|nr:PASTA domain-containing protein [Spirochaetota bacterium]
MEQNQNNKETQAQSMKSVYFKSIGRISFIFFIGFSFFILISFIMLIFLTKPENEVEVPSLVGKQYIDIHNSLIRRGLRPIIRFYDVFDIDNGIVLNQFPEPGEIIAEGSNVKLVVSRSSLMIDVPGLTGIELPFAINKLKNLHIHDRSVSLSLGVVSYVPSNTIGENIIIDHSPKKGEKVTLDRKINVLVSAGKKDIEMKMPDVTGQSIDLCYSLLLAHGLDIQQEISKTGRIDESGTVTAQSPAKGSVIKKGDTAVLKVQYYPVTEHQYLGYEIIDYTIPGDEPKGLYEAVVEDNKSKRICYSRQMSPGQRISFVFHRTGNSKISILANKNTIKVMTIDVEDFR